MTDKRFKKIDYKRELKTSQDYALLCKDIIKLIRYYQYKSSFDGKHIRYITCNDLLRLKMEKYLIELKSDLSLWYKTYKFWKHKELNTGV